MHQQGLYADVQIAVYFFIYHWHYIFVFAKNLTQYRQIYGSILFRGANPEIKSEGFLLFWFYMCEKEIVLSVIAYEIEEGYQTMSNVNKYPAFKIREKWEAF